MTDDVPYGGGGGMLLKPEPIFEAVGQIRGDTYTPIILLTPQGRTFNHQQAQSLTQYPRLLFLCGHYEGVDERVRQHLVTHEISIGDYVLTGGELAALVVLDALARFIPGVLGAEQGAYNDSYTSGLLEGPHYTRPMMYKTWAVPDVVRSGNHALIARWTREQALQRTWERRLDLLKTAKLAAEDQVFLATIDKCLSEPNDI